MLNASLALIYNFNLTEEWGNDSSIQSAWDQICHGNIGRLDPDSLTITLPWLTKIIPFKSIEIINKCKVYMQSTA